jgi:hypothetical protein
MKCAHVYLKRKDFVVKYLWRMPVVLLLLSTIVLSSLSACGGSDTGGSNTDAAQKAVICIGDILLNVVVNVASGDVPLAVADTLAIGPPCIAAAVEVFSSSSDAAAQAADATPQISLYQQEPEQETDQTIKSNAWDNCTDAPSTLTFSFNVPFSMVVGAQDSQGTFTARPTATDDNALVAKQIFDQYNVTQNITSGPSQTVSMEVPAHKSVVLTLPIRQHYKYGSARITRNGTSTDIPWFYTSGFEQSGPITYAEQSC